MINCLILAAGEGKRLRPFTNDYPKGLVSLLGKPLVSYQIDNLNSLNIKNIAIVTGYKSEKFSNLNCQTFKNNFLILQIWLKVYLRPDFLEKAKSDVVISYGDIVYEKKILNL